MEKPILFKSDMVQAILDGRKTQTRRIIKLPRLTEEPDGHVAVWSLGKKPESWESNEFAFMDYAWPIETYPTYAKCPYGKVGDKLWVRENILLRREKDTPYFDTLYCADNTYIDGEETHKLDDWFLHYCMWYDRGKAQQIIPSIHMKKELARIWLEVTGVRVERVRDISNDDRKAEGVIIRNIGETYWRAFRTLWNSINKKRGYGWDKNPFVWVIEFKVIKP